MSLLVVWLVAAAGGATGGVAVLLVWLVARRQDTFWAAERAARDAEAARRAVRRSRRLAASAHRAAHRAADTAGTRPVVHVTWRHR